MAVAYERQRVPVASASKRMPVASDSKRVPVASESKRVSGASNSKCLPYGNRSGPYFADHADHFLEMERSDSAYYKRSLRSGLLFAAPGAVIAAFCHLAIWQGSTSHDGQAGIGMFAAIVTCIQAYLYILAALMSSVVFLRKLLLAPLPNSAWKSAGTGIKIILCAETFAAVLTVVLSMIIFREAGASYGGLMAAITVTFGTIPLCIYGGIVGVCIHTARARRIAAPSNT